jgi:LacI family transcriptional regulator
MKPQKYKITDVAKKAGVSPSTISRVLNNRPGVGEELRKKITGVIEELDYKPNTLARSFTIGSINVIAIILGDIRNPFYADLAFHMQKFLNEAGFMVMIFNTEYDIEKEVEYIRTCRQYNFAGLILITADSTEVFNTIQSVDMPVILVNRTLKNYTGDAVSMDNFQAGYMATKYLIELGHPNVAFLSGSMTSSAVSQRYQGYLQVLNIYQIPFSDKNVFFGTLKMQDGYDAALLYGRNIRNLPSAVVAVNDLMALGFINGLKEQGIPVPGMVSVVSIDNIMFSALHDINLTTVNHPYLEMSRHTARLILRRIKNPSAKPEKIILAPSLVIRGTTAQYNASAPV